MLLNEVGGFIMIINVLIEKRKITKYKLSQITQIPYTTINDICSEKTDLKKCSALNVYKIAKALEVTVEELLEPSIEIRIDFDLFKSNVCHQLKEMGDLEFITYTLTNNKIREYEKKKWYPECLYLLAMIDYLSRINDIPLYNDYDELRKSKLKNIVYPASVIMLDKALKNKNVKKEAFEESIPEFKRFNIVESDIRNVI